ncbi:unnamed protein product [Spirodela intermedia]|uniref:Uncharacterized protein n=1 Tax=Spirodela intermedia TaxID=51605 RepID=A0A7I8JL17_SPIIN|nr:unnamed protein product [Spirodela intermedia]CAA6670455.1 unnamed protein product [Spirodela intermedia]
MKIQIREDEKEERVSQKIFAQALHSYCFGENAF